VAALHQPAALVASQLPGSGWSLHACSRATDWTGTIPSRGRASEQQQQMQSGRCEGLLGDGCSRHAQYRQVVHWVANSRGQ
jgi:hypothetical protein